MSHEQIPVDQYQAIVKLCKPLNEAIEAMTPEEIVTAMKGFYAAGEENCPWYVFTMKHTMPAMLAWIGGQKKGYREAWGIPGPDEC